jgi:hypothetical protein
MSHRVQKISYDKSRKARERDELTSLIDLDGVPADMPCTYCFKRRIDCKMLEEKSRCGECVKRGRPCDGVLVASSREFSFLVVLRRADCFPSWSFD